MRRLHIFLIPLVFLLISMTAFSAESEQPRLSTDANVFGHVIDAETGEHVPFINIVTEGTRIGTITDASGHYLLTNLPLGEHRLVVQGMGYETVRTTFVAEAETTREIDIEIRPTAINLEEVVFTSSPTGSGFRYQPDQAYMGEELQRRSEATFRDMLHMEPGFVVFHYLCHKSHNHAYL